MAGAAMGDRRAAGAVRAADAVADAAMAADAVRAAGAVVWRPAGSGAQVVLVHRPKYDDWSFPKGKLEPGEHVVLAAVREVAEETGLAVTLGRRLPYVQYDNGGVPKRVDYWAATVAAEASPFEPNSEVDEVSWQSASRASIRLSYERDVGTLAEFRAGAAQTVPLILLRHASAGSKADWPNGDISRPLDAAGAEDTLTLAPLLRCFGAARVVSAPAERCVATVRPYAASIGGVVEIEAAFEVAPSGNTRRGAAARAAAARGASGRGASGRGASGRGASGRSGGARGAANRDATDRAAANGSAADWGEPDNKGADREGADRDAAAVAIARLAADNRPVVICAHRENLPSLLDAACTALGAPHPDFGPLRKCEFAVLHRTGGTFVALERYHPDGQALVVRYYGASGLELGFDEPAYASTHV
jgi:8-oxo-(d)GTP phosphatase